MRMNTIPKHRERNNFVKVLKFTLVNDYRFNRGERKGCATVAGVVIHNFRSHNYLAKKKN